MVFGVAMNSKKNTLVALLIAANFTEIKGQRTPSLSDCLLCPPSCSLYYLHRSIRHTLFSCPPQLFAPESFIFLPACLPIRRHRAEAV